MLLDVGYFVLLLMMMMMSVVSMNSLRFIQRGAPSSARIGRNRLSSSCMSSGYSYNDKFVYKIGIKDKDGQNRDVNVLDIPAAASTDHDPSSRLPTVVLLGTAQTVKTFSPHCSQFSGLSRLVVPELRCQGMYVCSKERTDLLFFLSTQPKPNISLFSSN